MKPNLPFYGHQPSLLHRAGVIEPWTISSNRHTRGLEWIRAVNALETMPAEAPQIRYVGFKLRTGYRPWHQRLWRNLKAFWLKQLRVKK